MDADTLQSAVAFLKTLLGPGQDWMSARNDPSSLQNFLYGGVGLQGLDPKFIQDPRFNYTTRMVNDPRLFPPNQPSEEGGGGSGVVFSPPGSNDAMDTAPVGVHSTLNIDLPDQQLIKTLTAIGPNPDFLNAARQIHGQGNLSQGWTSNELQQLRQWLMNQRNTIFDYY